MAGRPGAWGVGASRILKAAVVVWAVCAGAGLVAFVGASAASVGRGTITTVALNGQLMFSGEGGPAAQAGGSAIGVSPIPATAANGFESGFLIADQNNQRIRKVSGGTITTVAGNGEIGFSGDGGPATAAMLNLPNGVVARPGSGFSGGGYLIADTGNGRIRDVSAGGTITTVAGGGVSYNYSCPWVPPNPGPPPAPPGPCANGAPASMAGVGDPRAVALMPNGSDFVIATGITNMILKVANGTITRVAGTGTEGFSGDGGQATQARLNDPQGVAVDQDGNILIGDTHNNRVRMVDHSTGVITTVAGNGSSGRCANGADSTVKCGDGGPATQAHVAMPYGVSPTGSGDFLIADQGDYRVREVSGGKITTVAGNGLAEDTGDGGPSICAAVDQPYQAVPTPDGGFLIADTKYVRKVTPSTTKCADLDIASQAPPKVSLLLTDELFGSPVIVDTHELEAGDRPEIEGDLLNHGPDSAGCRVSVTSPAISKDFLGDCNGDGVISSGGSAHYHDLLVLKDSAGSPNGAPATLSVKVEPTRGATDPDPGNNTITITITVRASTNAAPAIKQDSATGASGTLAPKKAVDTHTAAHRSRITRVMVAILQISGKKACRWVKRINGGFTRKRPLTGCDAPVWLRAKGTTHWRLKLTRRLPRGTYVFLTQAFDAHGDRSSAFSGKGHTSAKLVVRR